MNILENKNVKAASKKAEEHISNKVLSMFMAGAVLLWAFSYLYKLFDYPITYTKGILVSKIVMLIALAGVVCGIVWYVVTRIKNIAIKDRVVTPFTFAGFFAVVGVSAFLLYNDYVLGMKLIYALVPAAVIFYLIYNVYQRAFLYLAISHSFIALVMYFMSKTVMPSSNIIMGAICIIVCGLFAGLGLYAL